MSYQSTIPDDLAIVSEYAREQLLESQLIAPRQDVVMKESAANPEAIDIKLEDDDMPTISNPEAIDIKLEDGEMPAASTDIKTESVQGNTPVVKTEDALDAAIAGKAVNYDDSDISLSSSDDDSSDSDSDSEVEEENKSPTSKSDVDDDDDEEGEDNGGKKHGIIKTENEIVDVEVTVPTFTMTPQTAIVLAGEVFQIVDNVVVVQSRPGSEFTTLDQGSLLVYENREIMGAVFETFGPVSRPFYTVRFKSSNDIDEEVCQVKSPIFYVPDYPETRFVPTEKLKKIKGTDASNMYDEELPEEEMEFSDDEQEREFKKKLKRDKKEKKQQETYAAPPVYTTRDTMNDIDTYNSLASTIPPRRQQSYADMYDDFGADLDSYQQVQQQGQQKQFKFRPQMP